MAEEITYHVDKNITVTSIQIKTKNVTLMIDAVDGVECESSGVFARILMLIIGVLFAAAFLGVITGNTDLRDPLAKIAMGLISFFIGIGGIYWSIVGFGAVYVLTQSKRIIVVDEDAPTMRRVKEAISRALLNNKTQKVSLTGINTERMIK